MLISWYRAKKAEFKIRAMAYNAVLDFIKNRKAIVEIVKSLITDSEGISTDELQKKLIEQIASLAHEQAVKERKTNGTADKE